MDCLVVTPGSPSGEAGKEGLCGVSAQGGLAPFFLAPPRISLQGRRLGHVAEGSGLWAGPRGPPHVLPVGGTRDMGTVTRQ